MLNIGECGGSISKLAMEEEKESRKEGRIILRVFINLFIF